MVVGQPLLQGGRQQQLLVGIVGKVGLAHRRLHWFDARPIIPSTPRQPLFSDRLLDDLGYLPQGAEESEVLFTLIAERYERRSLGITSNLVFSQWEHIFANPMATAAAIDRVVHHSVILEFDVPSYRTGVAQQRGQDKEVNRQE